MIELTVAGANAPALVDDAWSHLAGYRWRLDKSGYVLRKSGGRRVYLHHAVMPGDRYPEYVRDHINRDKMDNRSENLRWLTAAESAQNKGPYAKNQTGFRGVLKVGSRYRAVAYLNREAHRLGYFSDPREAGLVLSRWRAQHMPASVEG